MKNIKIAIAGIGNCASSLLQGIEYYRSRNALNASGLMHREICGYCPGDIQVVAAFDVDYRKVGKDVNEAIFAPPNCTVRFQEEMPLSGVPVRMGPVLDGVSRLMADAQEYGFMVNSVAEPSLPDVVDVLKDSGAEILLNYLPVGSEKATAFYAEAALEAGVAFINNIPVFIASNPDWAKRFQEKQLPLIGDDIKAQIGATITHRALADLFASRGVQLDRTYQINTGGNTDFLNMLDRTRLDSKKKSKTEAVQSATPARLPDRNIHIGPSDYIPWLNDNKVCFIRMEGRLFGNVPMNLELRLSVEDSPNSAGVAIDTIRCCKIALDRNLGGALISPSAFYCKSPPEQFPDHIASAMTQEFIDGRRDS